MTLHEVWSRILPILDTSVSVDLHLCFGIDLDDEEQDVWNRRSWHWLRDRILRLRAIPGTATREAMTATDV